jgi:hypothetical protein
MTLDFTLERPKGGSVFYTWRLIVDGCDTGNILYNGPPNSEVPALPPAMLAVLMLALLMVGAWMQRERRG